MSTPDGQKVVAVAKRPGADRKVHSHLRVGSRYIARLRQKNVPGMSRLFGAIVDAMEEILKDEMDLSREIKKFETIKGIIDQYEASNHWRSYWTMTAPRVLKELGTSADVYFLEYIPGESLNALVENNQLSAEDAAEIGRKIVDFNLQLFLRYGIFDPDRHKGNFLIDVKSKKIVFIDPGQLLDFHVHQSMVSWDIRLGIAKLLESIDAKDVSQTLHYALQISLTPSVSESQRRNLESQLTGIFKGPEEQIMLQVLNALYDAEISYDWKITFGLIKGMLLLSQENYVPMAEFKRILKERITELYLGKLPALGVNWWNMKVEEILPSGTQNPKPGLSRCEAAFQ